MPTGGNSGVTAYLEPFPLGKFRRIGITVDASGAASTATETLVTIINGESGTPLYQANVATLADVFAKLGFDVQSFSYSPPRG